MHAPCSPFPLLRSRPSPACVERPVKSHPETFCVGVSDSGVAGRIRGSGRMNNVYLLSRPVRSFTIEPSGFHKSASLPSDTFPKSVANSQSSRHSDLAANICTHHHMCGRDRQNVFCLRDVRSPPYIFMYPCLGSYRETGWGTCSTEFS